MYNSWEEFKPAWVAALRSGEYKQGSTALNKDNRFCCLGVAADLLVKAGQAEWLMGHGCKFIKFGILEDSNAAFLDITGCPVWLKDWLGTYRDGGFRNESALIRMNDEGGKTFNDIADWIDANG